MGGDNYNNTGGIDYVEIAYNDIWSFSTTSQSMLPHTTTFHYIKSGVCRSSYLANLSFQASQLGKA